METIGIVLNVVVVDVPPRVQASDDHEYVGLTIGREVAILAVLEAIASSACEALRTARDRAHV